MWCKFQDTRTEEIPVAQEISSMLKERDNNMYFKVLVKLGRKQPVIFI